MESKDNFERERERRKSCIKNVSSQQQQPQEQQQVITKHVVVVESKTESGAIKRSSITDLSLYKLYKNIMMSIKNEKEKLVSD